MKTYTQKQEEVKRKWYLIDAENQILGRLATRIADILNGKNEVTYTPHTDSGDFVVVVNADKIRVTGRKMTQKMYYKYTGYPGGLKSKTFEEVISTDPERVIHGAVKGMLPKNRLSPHKLTRLKVYTGSVHPHEAQNPEKIEL
ncbi:MAG: 50S ribosomal protein L13 [Candidatus Wallbacteria bacterium]|nr:50S ribosomal protein L13 [Candidatus Wallbacteria bacterium]